MSLWTTEDINKILIELDKMKYPFQEYSVSSKEGGIKLLGKGGSAYVFEAWTRFMGRSGYALKVLGFTDQEVDSDTFKELVSAQISLERSCNKVIKIYAFNELWISFDSQDRILSVSEEKPDNINGNILKLQFVIMDKLPCVFSRGKDRTIQITPTSLSSGDEKEIYKVACDIGAALKSAHERKILHRDVKLENVFYDEKKKIYKLGDFGIAKKTKDGFAGSVAFTNGYAAPEVQGASGKDRYDNTADVYSFGMMLYVLANNLKFPDSKVYNVINQNQYIKGYTLPRPENEAVSEDFYAILVKACMYNPDDRYQSISDMLADIERLMYEGNLAYKRRHHYESLVVGAIFLIAGVILWKLIMAPDLRVNFSFLEYLILIGGLAKGVLKLLKKSVVFVSFIMLCIGIYLLMGSPFSWGMLLLLLIMVMSSGNASSYLGACGLLAAVIDKYQQYSGISLCQYSDYKWTAVLLLSLALLLLYEHELLELGHDDSYSNFFMKTYFYKDIYWGIICIIYLYIMTQGLGIGLPFYENPIGEFTIKILSAILGQSIIEVLLKINYTMLGGTGVLFCLFWLLRRRLLVAYENRKVQKLDG